MNNSQNNATDHENYHQSVCNGFPQLHRQVNQQPLVYLDSAATTLKHQAVINATIAHYQRNTANVHRASHTLSREATTHFEQVREDLANYLGITAPSEIIWTSGATASINLVAFSFIAQHLSEGDEIIISAYEHHANLIPWQQLAKRCNAKLKIIPLLSNLMPDLNAFMRMCGAKTKLVAITGLSNALGYAPELDKILSIAKRAGAFTLVDGAQMLMHGPVNVKTLDCDFFVSSAHKMFGPTGCGFLYGRLALLKQFTPLQFGGEMVEQVSYNKTQFAALPYCLEAGTPNIAGVIGFGAAIEFLASLDWQAVQTYEQALIATTKKRLMNLPKVSIVGDFQHQGIISFTVDNIHHHDIAQLLDQQGVALRVGHHCAMPLLQQLKLDGIIRVSIAMYTRQHDIDLFITALQQAIELLEE